MAIDPVELMSPRERLSYNASMRKLNPDGSVPPPPSGHATPSGDTYFGADGLDFEDFLDIINPLQHIPLVSIAYRSITGDEISSGARVIGGGLFGGPAGVFLGAINAAMAEASGGEDFGAFALNTITGEDPTTAVASAEVGEIAPSAGGIVVTAVAKPWIDPDSLPVEASAATPPTEDGAQAPQRIVPSPTTPDTEPKAGAIPELSEDQVSLLLSSVGIDQKVKAPPSNAEAKAPAAPAPNAAPIETPIRRATPAPVRDVQRVDLGPMKQTYIRAPVGTKYAPHAPITPEMRTHMSRPTVAASDADPAWISKAMADALDKYRTGKVMEQAEQIRGSSVDGSF